MKSYLVVVLFSYLVFPIFLYSDSKKDYEDFKTNSPSLLSFLESNNIPQIFLKALTDSDLQKERNYEDSNPCYTFSSEKKLVLYDNESLDLSCLKKTFSGHDITLLHYLSMINKMSDIKLLFEYINTSNGLKGNNHSEILRELLSIQDINGWTPAHFAALQDDDTLLNLLIASGADLGIEDYSGATPLDLWHMSHVTYSDREPNSKIRAWSESENRIIEVPKEAIFQSNNDVIFTSHIKRHSIKIIEDWITKKIAKQKNKLDLLHNKIKHLYPKSENVFKINDYGKENSDLENDFYLKHVSLDNSNNSNSKTYGLFTSKDLSAGQFILEYPGLLMNEGMISPESDEYSYENVDGAYVRGYASYINECTPNIATINYYYRGAPRVFEMTLRDIKKGEQICKDYLTHPIKKLMYRNFSEDVIQKTIAESPNWIQDMVEKSQNLYKTKALNPNDLILSSSKEDVLNLIESLYATSFLTYVFGTNSELIKLFARDKVTKEDLLYVLENFKMPNASYSQCSFNPSQDVKKFLAKHKVPYLGLAMVRLLEYFSTSPKYKKLIFDYINEKNELLHESDYVTSAFIIQLSLNLDEVTHDIEDALLEDNAQTYLDNIWEETRNMILDLLYQSSSNGDAHAEYANRKVADFISSKPKSYLKNFIDSIFETFNFITKGSFNDS